MTTLYGISNCDSVRKARRWLEDQGIAHRFHDLRRDGLDEERLRGWASQVGWETLLNRRSSSWRQLPAADREHLDGDHALALMLAQPTLIKRPVIEHDGRIEVGFSESRLQVLFSQAQG
ncbi:ArsC family reductase [Thiohalobacter sp. IOR34]|uniref:ArsC family reductase n=1 Tax=Thiohalobacter sp. IOR34 TaxID=3057176 RepID=UPI0025B0B06D|nr:ArsC family reductase [Thiohalobacter sp. IOR34]WJW76557.1 ArsC family reductase [Thiohalobacter sp. IOR34]